MYNEAQMYLATTRDARVRCRARRAHWPRRGRYLDTIVRARGAKQARAAAKPFYALRRARDPLVELVETYPRPRRGRRHVRVVQKHLIR